MGFLKKVFKPVAKVLDKIVPNEIKPFLPYAAAFAPVFGPTAGIFGSTMMKKSIAIRWCKYSRTTLSRR